MKEMKLDANVLIERQKVEIHRLIDERLLLETQVQQMDGLLKEYQENMQKLKEENEGLRSRIS